MNVLNDKISLREQDIILKECISQNIPLTEELRRRNLTYDNLRYSSYVNGFNRQGLSESIDSVPQFHDKIPAISFFTGAGGLDVGFSHAGFQTIASIESNELFCDTLRHNKIGEYVIGPPEFSGDASSREEIKEILEKKIGVSIGFNGVFHGGPPCQPFSIASNQRYNKTDINFKRRGFGDIEKGNLLFDYIWYIEQFKPRCFLIENVPGLEELDDQGVVSQYLSHLAAIGYNVTKPTIINSADYGVPQSRKRLYILGARSPHNLTFPLANTYQSACYDVFFKSLSNVLNHNTRNHTAQSILRYCNLDYGARDKLGRVDRLNPYLPSKTVIAGGTKGGGRSHLHPYIPRTLSVRESARLQTFPDSYEFLGSSARQFTQVGNAVPPLLSYKIACKIKETVFS